MPQRVFRRDVRKRRDRHLAKRSSRRGEDDASNFFTPAAVQALVNRIVLAVDRKNGYAMRTRGGCHERTRHHQHFLVRERNCLAGLDGRQHGLERIRARGRADDDIDIWVRRYGDEPLAARLRSQRGDRGAERRGLFAQSGGIRSGGKPHDLQLVWVRADDVERTLPNRSRRPENRELFQKLYLTNT